MPPPRQHAPGPCTHAPSSPRSGHGRLSECASSSAPTTPLHLRKKGRGKGVSGVALLRLEYEWANTRRAWILKSSGMKKMSALKSQMSTEIHEPAPGASLSLRNTNISLHCVFPFPLGSSHIRSSLTPPLAPSRF